MRPRKRLPKARTGGRSRPRAHFALCCFILLVLLPARMFGQEKPECTLPDCDQAKAFFQKFQAAVDSDQKQDVVTMVRYPLRSYRNGKATVFKSKTQLLAGYDRVFTPGVRCAIKLATVADVWGLECLA